MQPPNNCETNTNLLPEDGELYYFKDFLSVTQAQCYFENILNNIPWQQRAITLFGKTVQQPRLISWHAAPFINYKYSGIHMQPAAWTTDLLEIKNIIENKIDYCFNSAFLNLYRNGQDYMGWHRDNEKSLGSDPFIASISLGIDRKFKLKHMHKTDLSYQLTLESGSLLIMAGEIQHHWKHCLPKSKKIKSPRINITFRKVINT